MEKDNKGNLRNRALILISLIGVISLISFALIKAHSNSIEKSKIYSAKDKDKSIEEVEMPDPEEVLKKEAEEKDANVAKNSVSAEDVSKMLKGTYEGNDEKIVFLTFDDGPSETNTPKVLDILNNYGVKATFFLLGQNIDKSDESKELVKRMYNEGHSIGNHTYTHNIKRLYPGNNVDTDVFFNEIKQTNDSLKAILGNYFKTRILRMPGGYMTRQYYNDVNLGKLNDEFINKGYISIDWNALSKDAEGRVKNSDQLLQETIKTSKGKNKVIILMHDTYGKENSVQALPKIIEYFSSNGYEFKSIK